MEQENNNPTNLDYSRKGYIKDIYIELPFYKYLHGPIEVSDTNKETRFLGREKIKNRLLNILKNGKRSGAYLVTGYRGMGKTSYVNQVLREYHDENPKLKIISLCLNQENLKTRDIYQQVLVSIKNSLYSSKAFIYSGINLYFFLFSILLLIFFTLKFKNIDKLEELNNLTFDLILVWILILVLFTFIVYQIITIIQFKSSNRQFLLKRISAILDRINGEITKETGTQGAGNKFPIGFINRKTNKYLTATTKEIESEVIEIIDLYNRKLNIELIFVFDELDKVELNSKDHVPIENNFETIYQKSKKGLVIEILSGLKHFITRAPAKFIFIAGREMFDAALADINDRQSSISSIFHQIINVDSFLRDKTYKNTKGITNLIEEYLREILLPDRNYEIVLSKVGAKKQSFFRTYYLLLKKFKEGEKLKIIFALQNLLIYLTYRSNGSPHKLNTLVEELIVNNPSKQEWKYIKVVKENLDYYEDVFSEKHSNDQRLFLKLSYTNQYRHSFISYLYRPFILTYSRYLKDFSDNVLYSTPYLMDHLIKFHPFAFSKENLELLPEIISSNRQPSIRFFAEELISFFRQNLLREIELGLFKYKYFKKVINEIEYISKTFENEAAAFNFTQDENFAIKLQIRKRIKKLRDAYKDFIIKKEEENIFSITYLNILLGDAHFFDHEFNEATIVYQDALHYIKLMPNRYQSIETFILLLKVNLKIGLAFEKMKSYDLALSHYSESVSLSKKFFYYWQETHELNNENKRTQFSSPSYFDELLQICVQGFLAKIYLQEKLGTEGATINKVMYLQRAFLDLLGISKKITKKRNRLAFVNFNLNVGTLFFFKNPAYSKSDLNRFYTNKELHAVSLYREELTISLEEKYQKGLKILNYSPYAYIAYCTCLMNVLNTQPLPLLQLLGKAVTLMNKHYNEDNKSIIGPTLSKVELKIIATILTKIGDVLLSYLPTTKNGNKDGFNPFSIYDLFTINIKEFNIIDDKALKKLELDLLDFSNCKEILDISLLVKIFYLSAQYYLKAEISVSASFQIRKIFHVIRLAVRIEINADNNTFFSILEDFFLSKVLSITSWNSSSSDRPQIDKYKYYFGEKGFYHSPELSKYIYMNISNSPEIKEALLFYSTISMRKWIFPDFRNEMTVFEFDKAMFVDQKPYFIEQSLISETGCISSQFTRILELAFLERVNQKLLTGFVVQALRFKNCDFISTWPDDLFFKFKNETPELRIKILEKELQVIKNTQLGDKDKGFTELILKRYAQLVSNSIFCLTEIIKIIHVCGVKYMLSYSYLATFHRRLGNWLKHFSLIEELYEQNFIKYSISKSLVELVGTDVLRTLDPTSQIQLAIQNYRRAIQLHTQGKTYHKQISNMSYLEDDFNDNLYHYCAAIEKQQINSGRINEYIEKLSNEVEKSQLLKVDRYMNKY